MAQKMRKFAVRCPTCRGRRLLAVAKDHVECPTCDAAGAIEVVETTFSRPPRRTLIADTVVRAAEAVA